MSYTYTIARPDTADSVLEFGRLNSLARATQRSGFAGSAAAEEDVARQFEALLIQQMLKQARQASAGLHASPFDSDQTRLAQSMNDEQLALQLAKPGIGLAQALLDQIRGNYGTQVAPPESRAVPDAQSASESSSRLAENGDKRKIDASSLTELIEKLGSRLPGLVATFSVIQEAPRHIQAFVSRMADAVQIASAQSGIPARLIMSQAALESGWGQREIRFPDGSPTYNIFGIKAGSRWTGKVADIVTTEYENGEPRKLVQTFRAYDSYEDALQDYVSLVGGHPRYREVAQAPSAEEAARRIHAAGYATDPAYSDKLIAIMRYLKEPSPAAPLARSRTDTGQTLAMR